LDKWKDGNEKSCVLVTGATGAVGPLVVKVLHDAGYEVRTLSADPLPDEVWPDGVESRIGDVTVPSDVRSAMNGVGYVMHLAALLHVVNESHCIKERYERINVDGTSNVVMCAAQSRVYRIVFFSTIAVYGESGGKVVTEESPTEPQTMYATTKLAAEKVVLGAKNFMGEPIGTVLRLGAVYGPRVKGNYQRLARSLGRGRFIPVGSGRNRRTLVYDEDVARAAILALQHPDAAGKIFNVSDGKTHTVNDIISAICQALGRKPPGFSLPVRPVRLLAGTAEDLLRLTGLRSPVVRATVDKYIEDIAVDSGRIQRELGFSAQYDLFRGWKETVAQMRRSGDLL